MRCLRAAVGVVLAAACSGRLTADWREEQIDAEPAIELVKRILNERKTRPALRKPPASLDNELDRPFELPESWTWTTWNHLVDWITYGFTRPMPHVVAGIPIVSAKNVRDGYLDLEELDFTTPEAFAALSEKDRPRRGEILITKDGAIRGRAALVDTDQPICVTQAVAVLRFGGLTA